MTVSGSTYSKTGLRSISVRSSWGVVVDVVAPGDSTSAHCMCAHACTSKYLSWVCTTEDQTSVFILKRIISPFQCLSDYANQHMYIRVLAETVPHEIKHM